MKIQFATLSFSDLIKNVGAVLCYKVPICQIGTVLLLRGMRREVRVDIFDKIMSNLRLGFSLKFYGQNLPRPCKLKKESLSQGHHMKGGRNLSRHLRKRIRASMKYPLSSLSSKALQQLAQPNRSFHIPECKELLTVSLANSNQHPLCDLSYSSVKAVGTIKKEDIIEVCI